MNIPSVFIGSSTEGLDVARALQYQLRDVAKVTLWNEGIFWLGQNYLEALTSALDRFNLAILIFRADDTITSRDETSHSTRGNVLFELGLFMGRLGRSRTFVVYDTHKPPRVISDLKGITFAPYDGGGSEEDLLTSVGPACFEIRRAIKRLTQSEPVSTQIKKADPIFFPTAEDFGSESAWLSLLDHTNKAFDILGLSLAAWRKMDDFKELLIAKALKGCRIRALLMHKDNYALRSLVYHPDDKDYGGVIPSIEKSLNFFTECAQKSTLISVRQMRVGCPHFSITRSDETAVILQYLHSETWSGPFWKCYRESKFYSVVENEFKVLWELNRRGKE